MPYALVMLVDEDKKVVDEFVKSLDELGKKGASFVYYTFGKEWDILIPYVLEAFSKLLGDYDMSPHLPPKMDLDTWKRDLVTAYVTVKEVRNQVDRLEKIIEFLDSPQIAEKRMKVVEAKG